MIRLLKNLLSYEPLPPHIHFHLDDQGHEVWCDETVCRPSVQPGPPFFAALR